MSAIVASRVRMPVASAARPVAAARPFRAAPVLRRGSLICRADPKIDVEGAIKEAEEACAGGSTGECAAAWDTVEELSAAVSHKKDAEKASPSDPLEEFCESDPSADECRVYED